ncbi:hypothetical protein FHU10_3669 [Serratia fonticola]|uniref:Uncharacterized protein n=1 Tax=Serratia fonticola TaxID=47917 RepID=A0A542BS53_SERFO|nr:hypothetical protein FHU09_4037 [Serratia fonticola]TQI96565.1 hypothetical protein FHU11_2008 [Serratia fonticola]TVZ71062.1 hypothetical protein FHU10_3669 [Serratia fonticola]
MKKIIAYLFKDLFWTYIPAVTIVVMACFFASFFPDIWGRLTIAWIIITYVFVWKLH